MPVQTEVKPKLKQPDAQPAYPTPCTGCDTASAKHMVETYVMESTNRDGEVPTATRKYLCGHCLVGHDVAVLRGSDGGMSFGEVTRYDDSQLRPFHMSFLDGTEEWVEVSSTPLADYLNWLGLDEVNTPPSSPTELDQGSIGSFSSETFSSVSSDIITDGAFPLFEESRVVHMDDSPSSFETMLSDDEENTAVQKYKQRASDATMASNPMSGSRKKTNSTKSKAIRSPQMWRPEEDRNLQRVVDSFRQRGQPLKWPHVAEHCPNRNGKQCRERYLNHLSSELKSNVWSPQEDASLFQLFFRHGKKWSKISQFLHGRTDNGTKNRFHHLKRRLNKDSMKKQQQYSSVMSKPDDESEMSIDDDSCPAIRAKTRQVLSILAKESKRKTYSYIKGYVFGPYIEVTKLTQCKRCGLFLPSAQTGEMMCLATEWCEACCMTPPYVAHDLLRECLNLRDEDSSTQV